MAGFYNKFLQLDSLCALWLSLTNYPYELNWYVWLGLQTRM